MPITLEERRSIGTLGVGVEGCSLGCGVGLRRVVESSHRSAFEGDPMDVVEESVEDGVAEGGVADDIVPVVDGHLAGEQRATAGVAVVEDLEEVVASLA